MSRLWFSWRTIERVLVALCVLLFVLLLQPAAASAQTLHAILQRSDPQDGSVLVIPPTTVHLWFSEPVQLVGSPIAVSSPTNKAVPLGAVRVSGSEVAVAIKAQEEGTYLVTWQVISQDTDPASGSFVFSVRHSGGIWSGTTGQQGATPLGLWLQVLARWLHLLGFALGFGVLAFRQFILLPLRLEQDSLVAHRLQRLVTIGIVLLVIAEPMALLAQTISLGALQLFAPNVAAQLLMSSFGRVLAQRLGAAILLWVLLGAAKEGGKRAYTLALLLGIALAVVDSQASHAVVSRPLWAALTATSLHIIAMVVWVGGLSALCVVWRVKSLYALRMVVLTRFGALALAAVVELALSGALLAWLRFPRLTDLVTTAYGWTLVLKSGMLLGVLVLVVLTRGIQQTYRERWWLLELLALASILVLAGLLVSLPPPLQ